MQLRALKVFCDVVGYRSFSRAAEENGISQSGASQVVHQLETGLGARLIDRSKRPFVLTPAGETYYAGCRRLVERYLALEEEIRTMNQEPAGRLRVASIYSVGLHYMNQCLKRFMTQWPKVNVRLEYQHPNRVSDMVEHDQADVGLISYPKSTRTITALPWREEPMLLVCHPQHRLAASGVRTLGDLDGEKMIGFDASLTIRREIDRVLDQHGVEVDVVMEFDNIETIKRAVEIDAGIALLPEPTVAREVQAGSLSAVRLPTDELKRPIGIIHRRGKELGKAARRFIELLQDDLPKGAGRKSKADPTPEAEPVADELVSAGTSNGHASNSNGHTGNGVSEKHSAARLKANA
jgi:DNA-binding transcriptional LysR family regulator